jgi:AcrR family transcriptional regulator
VTYYFGSKKNLYLYLVEMCGKIMVEEMEKGLDPNVTDFFEKMRMMSDIKISTIKRHPAIMPFLASVYYETDDEVAEEIKGYLAAGMEARQKMVILETDTSRLRDDVDPALLDKFLVWAGEGFGATLMNPGGIEQLDKHMEDFYKIIDIMKKYFYKD